MSRISSVPSITNVAVKVISTLDFILLVNSLQICLTNTLGGNQMTVQLRDYCNWKEKIRIR